VIFSVSYKIQEVNVFNDHFVKSVLIRSAYLKSMWDIIIIDSVHRDGEIGLIRKLEEN
jgi:hypothetical protein